MDPLLHLLRSRFALPDFRGIQRSVIEAVLARQDTFALMPTGQGKTLCYQLPSLQLDGITLVISPLIALMRDQARRLEALSMPVLLLAGDMSDGDWQAAASALVTGVKLILLSPERVMGGRFSSWLERHGGSRKVELLVIDEAHCILEWGEAFRPSYRMLPSLRERFKEATWLLMTATADLAMQTEIAKRFGIPSSQIQTMSFNRPELYYQVSESAFPLLSALQFIREYRIDALSLVYCKSRRATEIVAGRMRLHGLNARAYHAGLTSELRYDRERWFQEAHQAVMVATIAFGMGVDQAHIRSVIHLDLPIRLVHYLQESGRAGRDGEIAEAILLHSPIRSGAPEEGVRYVRSPGCRRQVLLGVLGENWLQHCGACDHCAPGLKRMFSPPRVHRLPWVRRTKRET